MGRAFAKLRMIALGAGVAVGYLAFRMGKAAITEVAAFQKQMALVSTMLKGKATKQMKAFTKTVDEFAVKFGDSTESLSKGLYDILSAQIDASKATEVLRVAAKAAVGGATDTATAVGALVRVLNIYNIAAEDAAGVSDLLFKTMELGLITYEQVAQGIGTVAATAQRAGIRLHELLAGVAAVTLKGESAEKVFTTMRMMILKFISPTPQATRLAKKFGIELGAAALHARGLAGAFEQFRNVPIGVLGKMFPKATSDVVGKLIANIAKMRENTAEMEGAAGAAGRAFDKMAASAGFKLQQLNQAWKSVLRTVGEAILPIFLELGKWFLDNKEEIAVWAADFLKMLAVVGQAFYAVMNSIGGVVRATLGAFGVDVKSATDGAASKFEWLENAVLAVAKGMTWAFTGVEFVIRNLGPVTEYVLGWLKLKSGEFLQDVGKLIYEAIDKIWKHMQDNMWDWQKYLGIFFAHIANFLGSMAQTFAAMITNIFNWDNMKKEIDRLDAELKVVGKSLDASWDKIANKELDLNLNLNEKDAQAKLDELGKKLGAGFQKALAKNMKLFDPIVAPPEFPKAADDDTPEKAAAKVRRIINLKLPELKPDPDVAKVFEGVKVALKQQLHVVESRFLKEAPGRSQDPQVRTMLLTERAYVEQVAIRKATEETAKSNDEMFEEIRRHGLRTADLE